MLPSIYADACYIDDVMTFFRPVLYHPSGVALRDESHQWPSQYKLWGKTSNMWRHFRDMQPEWSEVDNIINFWVRSGCSPLPPINHPHCRSCNACLRVWYPRGGKQRLAGVQSHFCIPVFFLNPTGLREGPTTDEREVFWMTVVRLPTMKQSIQSCTKTSGKIS